MPFASAPCKCRASALRRTCANRTASNHAFHRSLFVPILCGPSHSGFAMLYPVALDPLTLPVPLLGRLVAAGFPSPADDYLEGEIDLSRYLIERPAATFLMRVSGESMRGAGILDGDLVVVDRSLSAQAGHVVVAVVQGDMSIK